MKKENEWKPLTKQWRSGASHHRDSLVMRTAITFLRKIGIPIEKFDLYVNLLSLTVTPT